MATLDKFKITKGKLTCKRLAIGDCSMSVQAGRYSIQVQDGEWSYQLEMSETFARDFAGFVRSQSES